MGVYVGPLIVVLWVFCVVDAILTRPERARNLPKIGWLVLVLLFPLVGSVAWLVAGRPRAGSPRSQGAPATGFPGYERPGRAAGVSPETGEEFLRRFRARAEEQRRRHREQQEPDDDGPPAG